MKIIIYPTDTAYAIGGDAFDPEVHKRIAKIKGRPNNKPFPWIAASFAMAEKYCVFSPTAKKLAKQHWPGPLTLILPLREEYHPILSSRPSTLISGRAEGSLVSKERDSSAEFILSLSNGLGMTGGAIAIRVPDNIIARKFSKKIGKPLIATSANISGKPMCYTITAVKKQFGDNAPIITPSTFVKHPMFDMSGNDNKKDNPDFYIDGGTLPRKKASTIAKVEDDGVITILRQGVIKFGVQRGR